MTKDSKFSIIVPAYNEAQSIEKTISEIRNTFLKIGNSFEIIVVNDGSTDITGMVIDRLTQAHQEVEALHVRQNHGKGYAVQEGVAVSSGDYVVFMDADLDIHPAQIAGVLEMFKQDNCDVAIGSKRHPESEVDYPSHRVVISNIYYWIVKTLFGLNVRDTQAGLKIYKRKVLNDILPRLIVKKFAFDLEMLVAAHKFGYRILEFPIKVIFSRKYGRITLRDCWYSGIDTLAIFYRNRILDFYSQPLFYSKPDKKVSVIIPLKIPDENIEQCITTCLDQNYDNFEIIILPDKIHGYLKTLDSNPRIDIIPTGSVNPSVKRNIGAKAATGQLLAFLDDDAFPEPDWLSNGARHFFDNNIAAVGGPAVTPSNSPLMEQISGAVFASPVVSGGFRYRYTPHRYQEVDDYPSCNFIIEKNIFLDVGGFSTQHWPGEDTLLCRDIKLKTDKKIVYDPHLIVEHRRRPIFIKHLQQVGRYAMHRGFFIKHWPENSMKPGYFTPSAMILFFLFGPLFYPFAIFKEIHIGIVVFYGLISIFFSIWPSSLKATILTTAGTIATHFTYGICFIIGLLKKDMIEHKPILEHSFKKTLRHKRES